MAHLDSESSDFEEDDYNETNVLLGYASSETYDDIDCHLGGQPNWIDPAIPPSATQARCKICEDLMVLLLQLNGNLPEIFPGHTRRIYLWICRKRTCKRKDGCVRVLRGVQVMKSLDETKNKPIQEDIKYTKNLDLNLGEHLFAANPFSTPRATPHGIENNSFNPFTMSCSQNSSQLVSVSKHKFPVEHSGKIDSVNPSSISKLSKTFAEALSIEDNSTKPDPIKSHESWPPAHKFPPAYPLIYLVDTDYEILDLEKNNSVSMQKVEFDNCQMGLDSEKEDKIVFESSLDQTFQKFAARLGQNPEQVIRYELKGQPLLYSKNDLVARYFNDIGKENSRLNVSFGDTAHSKLPRCQNCGANRVFEFQLTPQAILELERGENSIEDGMDWGTIMVGVCEKDCQQRGVDTGVGYVEEWVGVQWEEASKPR